MTELSSWQIAALAFAALAAGAISFQANADAVSDFYKGKQLAIQVGFGAGGGYDTTARIFARHYGKYIPGNPTVIVQNVPGGGSMKLSNQLYNAAPKNGLVLGSVSPQIMLIPLFGKRKAKFVTGKFEWIGSLHRDIMACGVWKGAGQGIKTLPDLIAAKKPIIFGSSSPSSPALKLDKNAPRTDDSYIPQLAFTSPFCMARLMGLVPR